jgi:hypothetical protein
MRALVRAAARTPSCMCLAITGETLRTYQKNGIAFGEARLTGVTREVCLHVEPGAPRERTPCG